jgi:O-antigen/teichoic acid export membrane protein
MAKLAIATGILLILVGVGFYLGIGEGSITALIPALFGLPIFAFGLVARDEFKRKHAMHAAALFGLLGFLGSFGMSFRKLMAMQQGIPVERPLAAIEQLVMAIICAAFVILCIVSFIKARRAA